MNRAGGPKIVVTVHRVVTNCGDQSTCPAFATTNADPEGGYVIGVPVTDPAVLAAFDGLVGAGEMLTRVPRRIGTEVFGS